MSEAIIFEFPYNLFIKQRLEFVVICHDQIAAAIMRIVECEMIKQKEAWQNKVTTAVEAKKTPPKEPAEYWVRLSHGQIIAKLYYYDSGKLEKPGEEATEEEIKEYLRKKGISLSKTTIRRTINLLIDLGFLLMRSKPGDEFGAPLYTLHRKNVQKALKSLPANPFSIFNQWEGVSNLEGGLSNLESGELAESEEGVSNLESPHFPNWKVNKDNKEISSKTSKDNLKEDTRVTAIADERETPSPSFVNGDEDATNVPHGTHHHGSNTLERGNTQPDLLQAQTDTSGVAQPTEQSTQQQIPQLNRLINPPEPPAENTSSTDESSHRIASETANETPSLPVVNAATDEVIHTDTRNTTNSYSPQSESKSTSDAEPVTEQAETPATGKGSGKGRGSGKSSKKQQDEEFKARMEEVYLHFEKLAQEMFDDPEYRTDRATSPRTELYKAVVKFIEDRGTREGMRLVFLDMWNEKGSDGEYWWRHPDHLTLRALCKNYSTRLASVRFNAKKQTGDKDKLPRPQSVSGMRNYTYEKGDPIPPPSTLPFEIAPQSSPEPLVKPGEQPTTRKKLYIKRPARNIS